MKKYSILLLVLFAVTGAKSQNGFAVDVGIGTSKAPMIGVKYYFDKNAASIGASYQIFNDALGKQKDLIPGTPAIGDGDYFWSFDVGYTRIINEDFSVSADLSFGQQKFYQNLSDDNFSQGGYHYIYKTKSKVGGGAYLMYNVNSRFGVFAGYNSLREATFGLEFRFVKEQQY